MNTMAYDKTDAKSIEQYGQQLIGKNFQYIIDSDRKEYYTEELKASTSTYLNIKNEERKNYKGKLGQLVEEKYFNYRCNSSKDADFKEAGVELKVTPYKINKNGNIVAKERVSLTMIDYMQVVNENFENSHLWHKCKCILFIWYLFNGKENNPLNQIINYVQLFTPPKEDLKIIMHDYEIIVAKIKAGKAHELSEGDTMYLGAAPKASSIEDVRQQPFSNIPARLRAFTYKNSYMTYLLHNYFIKGKDIYTQIMPEDCNNTFEDYVIQKIEKFKNWSIDDLSKKFELDIKAKNTPSNIAFRILGIKNNKAEEFTKANIIVKAIRIEKKGTIKQNMSFPAFRFNELINEAWDTSSFGCYLRDSKFFFVVYKFDSSGILRLKGCQFWNIPYNDLENDVKSVWNKTVETIKNGLKINMINGKFSSNLPKMKDNWICHVRPHAKDSKDVDMLPDGRIYPKQCFWLSSKYILSQLDEKLKN